MKRIAIMSVCAASLLLSLSACSAGDEGQLLTRAGGTDTDGDGVPDDNEGPGGPGTGGPGTGGPGTGDPGDPGAAPQCAVGVEYVGFDNQKLTADRVTAPAGVDRSRMKPFTVLSTEYPRVLGATPATLAASASTFGAPAARWYEEPQASAVALQTAFSVAFDGCLTFTATAATYADAPSTANAGAVCGEMARKFWSRIPAAQDIDACVTVATVGAAKEQNARRKWAYACASVLTSAGFLTY